MALRGAGEREPHLIVVGSSAGGIDALSSVLGDLPADFPAPIVLAQHIDPRRPSHLAPILARRSAMRVAPVEGRTQLEDGVVYVVPANRHVRIDDGYVDTVEPDSGGPRPSVDLLLETAARAYGETLIAVVLTGSGSDGAVGARAVRGAGGTVIVQNPSTAEFPGMPGSLAASSVDVVAELEAIPALLVELVSDGAGLERPEEERSLTLLLEQLRTQSGIDFTAYKRPTILRRLARRMAATGTRTVREYVRYLQRDPSEHARLVSSFLIKVTEFFRDPELYDHLRTTIIPTLVADAAGSRELRIWSAGCATGEEAYSLAIVIAEVLGDELPTWTVRIFATDLDPDAITYARRGLYAASSVERLPKDIVERYFDRIDGTYLANRRIRALTVFGQHDLAQRAPFPRIDLTVCRNVLIYFTPELQKRALQLFAFSLRDGGYLVLGKAETTTPLAIPFALEEQRLRVFRRRGPRTLMPAWSASPTPIVAPAGLGPVVPRGREAGTRGSAGAAQAEALLQELPVGVVVVNREYDIQSINAIARRLLQVHGTATGRDLIHLSRAAGIDGLRDLIDSALGGVPGTIRAMAQVSDGVAEGVVDVRIEAYPTPVHGDRAEGALLLVHDVTAEVPPRDPALVAAQEAEPMGPERRAEHAQRLVVSNRGLLADNEALVVMANALRSQNDDLLIATEEAQAATEEVETLNEELQATNEELETLNEELQSTIEELNTSTEDALARTHALEEMRVSLELQQAIAESERIRLATVLSAMGDAVVVVDRNGAEVLRNRAYADLMDRGELVPVDDSGERLPPDEALLDRAARGESFTLQFRATGGAGERHWFEVAGEPIPGDEGKAAGGVLVIRDITVRSLAAMQEEFLAIVTHELRTPLTALSGYLQLLGSDQGTAAERRRYVDFASGQARRLQELVGDLVDAVRVQTGHLSLTMAQVNLAELVRDTVGIVRPLTGGQEIDLQVDEEPWVLADAGRLQQVLFNVLTNAITHARASNRIELRVGDGAQAQVSVRDFGPGIPGERLAGLFSSTRPLPPSSSGDGLGLGLYISAAIMAAHGGGLTAVSEVGEGTTVVISLPAVPAPVASARA